MFKPDLTKNILSYKTNVAIGEEAQRLPYHNMKQWPLQLYQPYLYCGVMSSRSNAIYEIKIEYSYEKVPGLDYSWIEQGTVNADAYTSAFKTNTSKLFVSPTTTVGTGADKKYHNHMFVKTDKLNVVPTPGVQRQQDIDKIETVSTYAPTIVADAMKFEAQDGKPIETDDSYSGIMVYDPYVDPN